MISRAELEEIARMKRLTPLNCEKDYLQELLLFNLYGLVGRELVLKGGTCLYKVYKLDRFSEDLDFTMTKRIDIKKTTQKLLYSIGLLGIGASIKELKRFQNQTNIRLLFRGPLYIGTKESTTLLLLNISSRERVLLPPKRISIIPLYRDMPTFDIFAMDENEILAEKVRAIFERDKPRDVYDLWFLLKKGLTIDYSLIIKKVGRKIEKEAFLTAIENKRKGWDRELVNFIIGNLPDFDTVKKDIAAAL